MFSVATLHKKSGSSAPIRVFRASLRKMIAENHLPDYLLAEETGDMLAVSRRRPLAETGPHLAEDTLDAARSLAPGADIHALVAEWHGVWEATGRPRLASADKAFLGWLAKREAG